MSSISKKDTYLAWFDGSAQPYSKTIGYAFIIEKDYEVIHKYFGSELKASKPEMECEYRALIELLRYVCTHKLFPIKIHGDCKGVIDRLQGKIKRKPIPCKEYYNEAMSYLTQYDGITLHLITREENEEADALSRGYDRG